MQICKRTGPVAALAAGAVIAAGLLGCGSSNPTMSQLRHTVAQYLAARTSLEQCSLYTTVYRTMNPAVLLSGACDGNRQLPGAEQAALRALRIATVQRHGADTTVTLGTAPGRQVQHGAPALTAIDLVVEHGKWRINGLTERASGAANG